MRKSVVVLGLSLAASSTNAQDSLPGRPVFVPGMYESESRNSQFQDQPVKSQVCIASSDFDTFMNDTLEQYRSAPHFTKACTLGETKRTADGFAFAMDCGEAKTIVTFKFSKDLVAQTIDTLIVRYKEASSSILTLLRRIGECPPGEKVPGKGL